MWDSGLSQGSATHSRSAERLSFLIRESVCGRPRRRIPFERVFPQRPAQLLSQAFGECPRHRRRHRVTNLSILLKSWNAVRPNEIVGKALNPRTLANCDNAMISVMYGPQRTKIP